jgi:hypothetical protein
MRDDFSTGLAGGPTRRTQRRRMPADVDRRTARAARVGRGPPGGPRPGCPTRSEPARCRRAPRRRRAELLSRSLPGPWASSRCARPPATSRPRRSATRCGVTSGLATLVDEAEGISLLRATPASCARSRAASACRRPPSRPRWSSARPPATPPAARLRRAYRGAGHAVHGGSRARAARAVLQVTLQRGLHPLRGHRRLARVFYC